MELVLERNNLTTALALLGSTDIFSKNISSGDDEAASRLTRLWLDRQGLVSLSSPVGNRPLASFANITHLYLQHNKLADSVWPCLEPLSKLKFLTLAYNRLTTVSSAQHFTAMLFLDISYNRLRDLAAEELPSGLRFLNIKGNPFGLPLTITHSNAPRMRSTGGTGSAVLDTSAAEGPLGDASSFDDVSTEDLEDGARIPPVSSATAPLRPQSGSAPAEGGGAGLAAFLGEEVDAEADEESVYEDVEPPPSLVKSLRARLPHLRHLDGSLSSSSDGDGEDGEDDGDEDDAEVQPVVTERGELPGAGTLKGDAATGSSVGVAVHGSVAESRPRSITVIGEPDARLNRQGVSAGFAEGNRGDGGGGVSGSQALELGRSAAEAGTGASPRDLGVLLNLLEDMERNCYANMAMSRIRAQSAGRRSVDLSKSINFSLAAFKRPPSARVARVHLSQPREVEAFISNPAAPEFPSSSAYVSLDSSSAVLPEDPSLVPGTEIAEQEPESDVASEPLIQELAPPDLSTVNEMSSPTGFQGHELLEQELQSESLGDEPASGLDAGPSASPLPVPPVTPSPAGARPPASLHLRPPVSLTSKVGQKMAPALDPKSTRPIASVKSAQVKHGSGSSGAAASPSSRPPPSSVSSSAAGSSSSKTPANRSAAKGSKHGAAASKPSKTSVVALDANSRDGGRAVSFSKSSSVGDEKRLAVSEGDAHPTNSLLKGLGSTSPTAGSYSNEVANEGLLPPGLSSRPGSASAIFPVGSGLSLLRSRSLKSLLPQEGSGSGSSRPVSASSLASLPSEGGPLLPKRQPLSSLETNVSVSPATEFASATTIQQRLADEALEEEVARDLEAMLMSLSGGTSFAALSSSFKVPGHTSAGGGRSRISTPIGASTDDSHSWMRDKLFSGDLPSGIASGSGPLSERPASSMFSADSVAAVRNPDPMKIKADEIHEHTVERRRRQREEQDAVRNSISVYLLNKRSAHLIAQVKAKAAVASSKLQEGFAAAAELRLAEADSANKLVPPGGMPSSGLPPASLPQPVVGPGRSSPPDKQAGSSWSNLQTPPRAAEASPLRRPLSSSGAATRPGTSRPGSAQVLGDVLISSAIEASSGGQSADMEVEKSSDGVAGGSGSVLRQPQIHHASLRASLVRLEGVLQQAGQINGSTGPLTAYSPSVKSFEQSAAPLEADRKTAVAPHAAGGKAVSGPNRYHEAAKKFNVNLKPRGKPLVPDAADDEPELREAKATALKSLDSVELRGKWDAFSDDDGESEGDGGDGQEQVVFGSYVPVKKLPATTEAPAPAASSSSIDFGFMFKSSLPPNPFGST